MMKYQNNSDKMDLKELFQIFRVKTMKVVVLLIFLLITDVSAQKEWHFRKQLPFISIKAFSVVDSLCMYIADYPGLNRSTDGGITWTRVYSEVGIQYIRFHSINEGILKNADIIKYTSDGGVTWTDGSAATFSTEIRFLDSLTGISARWGWNWDAFFGRTTDGGFTWTWKDANLAGGLDYVDQVDSLVWGAGWYTFGPGPFPQAANILKYSTNYGDTWLIHSYGGLENYSNLELMNPNVVVLIIDQTKVRLSTDGGTTFYNYPKTHKIYTLRSAGDTVLYAGSDSGYIASSSDYGVTFHLQKMNTNSKIKRFDITRNGDGYAISEDFKLYSTVKLKVAPVDIEEPTLNTPESFSLSQNFPNPFNPETVIKFSITETGPVKGVVYDILGREVKTLLNGEMNPGNHQVKFDAAGIASGVYFFRLESGKYSSAIKMVISK
jgi:hypothetical protein